MDRIVFENGKTVSSAYLNEVQKGDKFTGDTRTNYYADPNSGDEAGWEIGQRDSLKDWEIADPREDVETGIGRLAHDGIVLGWDANTSTVLVPGKPATRPVNAGIGVTVEAGSFVSTGGVPISWSRQTVQILGGAGSTSYIYVSEADALAAIDLDDPVPVSIATSLPSVTEPHIPLAKLVLNGSADGLAVDPLDGEVIGTGYTDLRPNTFVGNLNTYPQNLRNTPIKSVNYTAKVWDRVIADTSNGSVILTLPTDPSDSDRVAIVDISGTFDRFPIIIRPNGSELLNNSNDDWIVNIRDAHLELFYHAATGQWKFEEAPGSECNPVLGSFLSCGGREFIGDRIAVECPDGSALPAVYPNPSTGVYSFEPSQSDPAVGKCYRVYSNTVALYANGTGGLITVPSTPRCDREGNATSISISRNTIYVDPAIGDDSIGNTGFDNDKPFRTLERALIEAVRESRRAGTLNDRYDRVMVELAPGDYYVDNSPGSLATLSATADTGLVQRTDTGYTVSSTTVGDRVVTITVDVTDPVNTQPPFSLNLGRVLYSQSGGVGNIAKLEKQSGSSSNWIISLEYVQGTFSQGDSLYYDNLSAVNPQTGGLVVPRGISIDGTDLRKVRIRPMYVPELSPVQNDPQTLRTAILKVTGGTYVSLITFTDNPQYPRSHNTVTSVVFASQAEINGSGTETPYYSRINNLFKDLDGWGDDGLEPIPAETTIVAPIAGSKVNRSQDIEENQTGLLVTGGDSRDGSPITYPGATRIKDTDGATLPLPDINSTRSSSPYVFNCSVRSIFGLNGLWAEGSRVSGFKSMVTANFTQVSLQTDPNCFEPTTYFQDPPTNQQSGQGKRYKTCTADLFKYRHFGMRGSNDAVIQIVSVFVIGNSDHFVSESGADLSITNSCSDFGDVSLRGIGYKSKSFSQDEATTAPSYSGTRITKIIPPLPLSYSVLPNGALPTLEDSEISTGLSIDYGKTLAYTVNNKTVTNQPPSVLRIYIQNSNLANPFNLTNAPSASLISLGQFSYTRKVSDGVWELSGGPTRPNRKRIFISGFDELGNSILYTGDIQLANSAGGGFSALDDSSKIFTWDPTPQDTDTEGVQFPGSGAWYISVTTGSITEEATDVNDDGYLLKKFDYAFRYKLLDSPTGQDAVFASLDLIFDRSGVRIIRGIDKRRDDERVYRVILDGFENSRGMRRPQPYYVLEKQEGVSGYPLNNSSELLENPLTVTQVVSTGVAGEYTTYLTQSQQARLVFTGDFYPVSDSDYPELTEDPSTSITKVALQAMQARTGVYFSAALAPSVDPINIKTSAGASTQGIRIGLRRPSVIRASNHTWEWTGYLNYDTAFPTFQGEPLEQDFALGKIILEEGGGRVYATGMNEEGNYYIGTTVFDLRSGEQLSIPLASESGQAGPVTNQVLSNALIRNTLLMQDDSSLVFGRDTTIFFSSSTQLKSLTTGDIIASANPPAVYATRDKAGLVQLAKPEIIRSATGRNPDPTVDKVAITPKDLSDEFIYRGLNNAIKGVVNLRLSLSSGSAVPDSNQINSTNLFLHPWNGNEIALYDSDTLSWTTVAGFSSVTAFSLAPCTAPNTNYDIYLYNQGTPALPLLAVDFVAWAGNNTPPARLIQNGITCKAGTPTHRFVGVVRTTSAGTSTVDLGGVIPAASSASFPRIYLANAYNLYDTSSRYFFGSSWDTPNANWGASPSGYSTHPRISYVSAGSNLVTAFLDIYSNHPDNGSTLYVAPGIDTTSGPPSDAFYGETNSSNGTAGSQWSRSLSPGLHEIFYLYQQSNASNTVNEHPAHGMILITKH